ncbi:MAG: hypothetical protein JW940_11280, partial [Polyangiaceae bacterium]|nr:hypothetical protein [Polyangiaceae bacterium]
MRCSKRTTIIGANETISYSHGALGWLLLLAGVAGAASGCAGTDPSDEPGTGAVAQAVTKAVDPNANGDADFCDSPAALCVAGEGDCDRNAQCATGLVCGTNNGPKFGMGPTYDVCVLPHCTDGVLTGGTDETRVDCGASGSDCGVCSGCPDVSENGDASFCSTICRCTSGQGDCDGNIQCASDLVCGTDNGAKFGMGPTYDVCVPPHCTDGVLTGGTDETGVDCGASGSDCGACSGCPDDSLNGDASFCTTACLCSSGQGDCDGNTQCESGLVCGTDNGDKFGMGATTDVCV